MYQHTYHLIASSDWQSWAVLSLTICIVRKCRCLICRRFEPGSICYESGALTSRPTKQLEIILLITEFDWIYFKNMSEWNYDLLGVNVVVHDKNSWYNAWMRNESADRYLVEKNNNSTQFLSRKKLDIYLISYR